MSAQNGTGNKLKQKKTTRKTSKKVEFEKGKVYIPAYKMIIFCACVIAVCITLLLISALKASEKTSAEKEQTKTEKIANENSVKPEKSKKSEKIEKVEIKEPEKITKPEKNVETITIKPNQNINKTGNQETKKEPEKKVEPVKDIQPEKEVQTVKEPEKKIESPKKETTVKEPEKEVVVTPPAKKGFDFPQAKNNAQLVFVFDDGGQNLSHLEKFLKLPFPCTIAVLPRITHSVETAKRVRNSGKELILHQPMQAVNNKVNPGPGAITPQMSDEEIISTLFQNITEIGPIAGLNNHEGSAITADAEKMAVVMKFASEEGIYFLDSRTNVETKVPYVAGEMGYSYYERNIFLDNEKTRENILKEINKGIAIANKNGVAIMIGHVWSADILPGILEEIYPELVNKGYTFKTVSECRGKK